MRAAKGLYCGVQRHLVAESENCRTAGGKERRHTSVLITPESVSMRLKTVWGRGETDQMSPTEAKLEIYCHLQNKLQSQNRKKQQIHIF